MAAPAPLDWQSLATAVDGAMVEIEGWMAPLEFDATHSYFFLVPELSCCFGCVPADSELAVEVFADASVPIGAAPVRLRGRWRRLDNDPNGWRWQLREARVAPATSRAVSRRSLLGGALALPFAAAPALAQSEDQDQTVQRILAESPGIDIHSHAGRVLRPHDAFTDVVNQMRQGGMAAICLAMAGDGPLLRVQGDGRIEANRQPMQGELYAWSRTMFGRLHGLAREQGLGIIDSAAALRAAKAAAPSLIIAAEGGDFLEGRIERVEEALRLYGMRHLQLTHYRPNELGDIQTEPPVHNGLTEFGADVIRQCNALGIVVDVAHGTLDLVKRAAEVSSKPLVISHTSLTGQPGPRSRQISADHARIIARTGGVIGVWPPATIYASMDRLSSGMARLADAVGVDHVGIGTDQRGLTGASVFDSYTQLPELVRALQGRGFNLTDIGKIIGGNYLRVFTQTLG